MEPLPHLLWQTCYSFSDDIAEVSIGKSCRALLCDREPTLMTVSMRWLVLGWAVTIALWVGLGSS